jgi:hypothetical protein
MNPDETTKTLARADIGVMAYALTSEYVYNTIDTEKKLGEALAKAAALKKKNEQALSKKWYKKLNPFSFIEEMQQGAVEQVDLIMNLTDVDKEVLNLIRELTSNSNEILLYAIGNRAQAAAVQKHLLEILSGSNKDFSDIAKVEIERVLTQLNQQIDYFERQDRLEEKVRALSGRVSNCEDSTNTSPGIQKQKQAWKEFLPISIGAVAIVLSLTSIILWFLG